MRSKRIFESRLKKKKPKVVDEDYEDILA